MKKTIYNLKKYVPIPIRKWVLSLFNFEEYRVYSNEMSNPYKNEPDTVEFGDNSIKVGIIFSKMHYHKFWIAACRELKVSYCIIYLERNDWQEQLQHFNCSLFLVWPDITDVATKNMQDERLRIMVEEMGIKVYPSLKETWLYENKRVQHDWLKVHGFPTPETWVFYDKKEVVSFLKTANYPLVYKSNLGASATGVYIVNNKNEAIRKAKKFLKDGYQLKGSKAAVRQKGSLYIQEYLSSVKEWRMVRIGDSYFGHGKDMKGQFHSGSGKANWDMPPQKAFDLLFDVTNKGGFTSMDVDMFEDEMGCLYINELQTVFGNSIAKEQLKKDGVPGRMIRDNNGKFIFEIGSFCQNHMCNLRLNYLLNETTDISK